MSAIKEYENNKWKVIGQKVGKPAKACEQYAKEHFPGRHLPDNNTPPPRPSPARHSFPQHVTPVLDSSTRLTHYVDRSFQPCEAWLGAAATNNNRGEESQGGREEFYTRQRASAAGPESTSSSTPSTCLFKSVQPAPTHKRAPGLRSPLFPPGVGQLTLIPRDEGPGPRCQVSGGDSVWSLLTHQAP